MANRQAVFCIGCVKGTQTGASGRNFAKIHKMKILKYQLWRITKLCFGLGGWCEELTEASQDEIFAKIHKKVLKIQIMADRQAVFCIGGVKGLRQASQDECSPEHTKYIF